MLTKDNKNLFQDRKINEKVELHSQCIIQMNKFHDELLLERSNYRNLKYKYDKLEANYNELKEWKENHICNNNNNINTDNMEKEIYNKLHNEIKEDYNLKYKEMEYKIFEQDKIINNLNKIESPIEDNMLFKELKKQNNILLESNKELKNKYLEIDDVLIKQKQKLFNEFSIEKENIKNEHNILLNNIKIEKDKAIEDLKLQLNNKYNKIKKSIENKSFTNTIKIYKEINKKSREYISSYTYRQINDYNVLRHIVIKENNNEENYDEIINYIIKYITNKNSNKYYFKRKITRCLYLYDNYNNNLKSLNFSISFISNLSEDDWNIWIKLLDKIIKENKKYVHTSNNIEDYNKNIKENTLKCTNEDCNNYYEEYEDYCDICNSNTKKCDNCGDEFITDKKYITECGDC